MEHPSAQAAYVGLGVGPRCGLPGETGLGTRWGLGGRSRSFYSKNPTYQFELCAILLYYSEMTTTLKLHSRALALAPIRTQFATVPSKKKKNLHVLFWSC